MQKVVQNWQAIKFVQNKIIKVQKSSFQNNLKKIWEKFESVELRSKTIEDKIKTLKIKEKTPKYSLAPSILVIKNLKIIPSSLKVINREKLV